MPSIPKLQWSRGHRTVRVAAGALLTACATMVVLGNTVFRERLRGPQFLLFWAWCMLLALLAIAFAIWDMVLIRRASRQSRRELFARQFMSREFVDEVRRKKDEQAHDGE